MHLIGSHRTPTQTARLAAGAAANRAAMAAAAAQSDVNLGQTVREARLASTALMRWTPGAPVYDATLVHLHLPELLRRLGVTAPRIAPSDGGSHWESYTARAEALRHLTNADLVQHVRSTAPHVAAFLSPGDTHSKLLVSILLPELLARVEVR